MAERTKADEVLDAIVALKREKGYAPTVREIGDRCGLSSSSTVHAHLRTLLRQGRIRHDPAKPRTIEVVLDGRIPEHLESWVDKGGRRRMPVLDGEDDTSVSLVECLGEDLIEIRTSQGRRNSYAWVRLEVADQLADQLRWIVRNQP